MLLAGAGLLVGARPGPDFTRSLRFANPAGCKFVAPAERALDGLLILRSAMPPRMSAPRFVALGAHRLRPRLRVQRVSTYPGGRDFTARADLPDGSRWNGLTLIALTNHAVILPEVDGLEERSLIFAEPARRLRAALSRMGMKVPIAPEWVDLPQGNSYSDGTCQGTMQLRPAGTGSELICSRGC